LTLPLLEENGLANLRLEAMLESLRAGDVEEFLKLLEREVNKERPQYRRVKLTDE